MNLPVSEFVNTRIEDILQNLRKSNCEYAFAVERSDLLMENIDSILHRGKDITISPNDCMDICEYLEQEYTASVITQQELYKQGYLDCIKLLTTLGILP